MTRKPIRRAVNCICLNCGKEFQVHPYRESTARYCSISCGSLYKQRIGVAGFQPGHGGYFANHSLETRKQMSETRKELIRSGRLHVWTQGPITDRERQILSAAGKKGGGLFSKTAAGRQMHREARARQIFPIVDTSIEKAVQAALNRLHLRFSKHFSVKLDDGSYHQIDVAFTEAKVAIECDGDYWHNRPERKVRDEYVNQQLVKQGWVILRLSEAAINADTDAALRILSLFPGVSN